MGLDPSLAAGTVGGLVVEADPLPTVDRRGQPRQVVGIDDRLVRGGQEGEGGAVEPGQGPDTPAFLGLYVADGDRVFQQALDAGATAVTRMIELFWGDRVGRVRDPLGNLWWIQERVAELTPEEIAERATRPEMIEAMRYVQGAQLVS